LVHDAYRAYAYFRWVDDWLDQEIRRKSDRLEFVNRQYALINDCYSGKWPKDVSAEEQMLVDLVAGDKETNSGLQSYIRNMMVVMAFDAERRNRLISQDELNQYAHSLAVGVTEAMHYFIGHNDPSPHNAARYLAVEAAHITHMLRDTLDDYEAGYFNIPREFLQANKISPLDVDSTTYRAWVMSRVQLARTYFLKGRAYLGQVKNLRCRLAGYAYTARFENVLAAIERDDYFLRPDYRECKTVQAGAQMSLTVLWSALANRDHEAGSKALTIRQIS
jgi:phytoene/squalene synthetase